MQQIFSDKPDLPNKYSVEIGERIRTARLENNLSQEELAKAIYKRRASLSDMENGKMLPDAFTLIFLANRLKKSLDYFIPEIYRKAIVFQEGELSTLEKELLSQFRRITNEEIKKLAINQVRALAGFEKKE